MLAVASLCCSGGNITAMSPLVCLHRILNAVSTPFATLLSVHLVPVMQSQWNLIHIISTLRQPMTPLTAYLIALLQAMSQAGMPLLDTRLKLFRSCSPDKALFHSAAKKKSMKPSPQGHKSRCSSITIKMTNRFFLVYTKSTGRKFSFTLMVLVVSPVYFCLSLKKHWHFSRAKVGTLAILQGQFLVSFSAVIADNFAQLLLVLRRGPFAHQGVVNAKVMGHVGNCNT